MTDDEAFRTIRRRLDDVEAALKRRPTPFVPGTTAKHFRVVNHGRMPTSLPGVFAANPVKVSGPEAAGGAVDVSDSAKTAYVTVVGRKAPAAGELLDARLLDGRWVAVRNKGKKTGPPPVCATLQFDVAGCLSPLNGVTVTATNGGVSRSGVTGSSGTAGRVFITVPNAGAWNYTAAPPAGSHYLAASGTSLVNSCGLIFPIPRSFTLGVEPGYSCFPDPCCHPAGPKPYPLVDWPTTVYLNDGKGAVACTGGGPNSPGWSGTATRRAAVAYDCAVGNVVFDVDVPVYFTVSCGQVQIDFARCAAPYGGCSSSPYPSPTAECGNLIHGNAFFGGTTFDNLFCPLTSPVACPPPVASGSLALGDGSTPYVPGTLRYDPKFPAFQVYGSTLSLSLTS